MMAYVVPARKPPVLRQRQRRVAAASQKLHVQVSATPTAEPILRFRAWKAYCARRNNRKEKLRVVVAAAPVAATQCRFSARIDDATGETVSSTRTNTAETTLFEVVYRGFNRRMLLSSEVLRFFSFPFGSAFPFAAGHRAFRQVGWKDCEIRAASPQGTSFARHESTAMPSPIISCGRE